MVDFLASRVSFWGSKLVYSEDVHGNYGTKSTYLELKQKGSNKSIYIPYQEDIPVTNLKHQSEWVMQKYIPPTIWANAYDSYKPHFLFGDLGDIPFSKKKHHELQGIPSVRFGR